MRFLIIFIISMIMTYYCQAGKLLDYRLTIQSNEKPKNCTAPGLFCETCSSLVFCMKDSDTGKWIKHPRETCTSPFKCVNQECTKDADPFCDKIADLPFPCQDVGIFPDPFYCNKFVLCVEDTKYKKLQPYLNKCEAGYGYNVNTGLCDVKLSDDRDPNSQCERGHYPIPLCSEDVIVGPLENKPAEYFICEEYQGKDVLYPTIHICSPGTTFNANFYNCTA